ncbi:MAG TPA: hypothetical protein VMG30_04340 [Acidobacteriota bacterium]|nr:hypothetical protein [Acidobacteriota bacterium]
MAILRSSDREQPETEELRDELSKPFDNRNAVAWEPVESDLWVPLRIRGSWRGGVLG